MTKIIPIKLSSTSRYTHTLTSFANEKDCVIPFKSESFLDNLVQVRKAVVTERDRLAKALFYVLGLLFLITQGSEFELPLLKLKLSELPSVVEILLIMGCIIFFITVLKFKDVMLYDSFIDLCIEKLFGGTRRERDVIKASKVDESIAFKIYNFPYFPGDREVFEVSKFGIYFDALINILLFLFFSILFSIPLLYLFYVSYYHVSGDIIGKIVSGVSQGIISLSLLFVFSYLFKFTHSYQLGDWKFTSEQD